MAERKRKPFVWVTWVAALLSGERSCQWSFWFRTKHERGSWTPLHSFDNPEWHQNHTGLLNRHRGELRAQGFGVSAEEQNRQGAEDTPSGRFYGSDALASGQMTLEGMNAEFIDLRFGEETYA